MRGCYVNMMSFSLVQNDLKRILLQYPEDCRVQGEFSQTTISQLESDLQVNLPIDYKSFLMEFGTVDFFGIEIYGLIDDDFKNDKAVPSMFWMTTDERKHGLPNEFVVIGSSGDGITYCINCKNEEIFGYVDYSFTEETLTVYFKSFLIFLKEQIDIAKEMT